MGFWKNLFVGSVATFAGYSAANAQGTVQNSGNSQKAEVHKVTKAPVRKSKGKDANFGIAQQEIVARQFMERCDREYSKWFEAHEDSLVAAMKASVKFTAPDISKDISLENEESGQAKKEMSYIPYTMNSPFVKTYKAGDKSVKVLFNNLDEDCKVPVALVFSEKGKDDVILSSENISRNSEKKDIFLWGEEMGAHVGLSRIVYGLEEAEKRKDTQALGALISTGQKAVEKYNASSEFTRGKPFAYIAKGHGVHHSVVGLVKHIENSQQSGAQNLKVVSKQGRMGI